MGRTKKTGFINIPKIQAGPMLQVTRNRGHETTGTRGFQRPSEQEQGERFKYAGKQVEHIR